ncbi:MAG: hypothetical protein JXR31_00260 [Prolixibacteraceae bacterium]|nr:hypothetical protein [Prolixibacteraceae bacterium]MBN2772646.1 hypothetical protein [Prolixibacteraceae bacterium]
MKQKIFLIVVLLTGMIVNLSAQQTEDARERAESRERARSIVRSATEPQVVIGTAGVDSRGYISIGGEEQRVSLNLSKHFDGESISSEADFEVSDEHSSISLNLSGSCDNGDITITIIQPNGEVMKKQKITNAADISWSIRFTIKEGEEKKYIGKWQLKVEANKAEGHYNLNINSR